jgi:AsmA protein
MRRLRKLALALLACLVFAIVAPLYFAERRIDESFAIATAVSAAPRDLHVVTVPVRLSDAPDLTLMRAVIYDYGPSTPGSAPGSSPVSSAPGGSVSQAILEGPVFTLNASGRRAALAVSRGEAEGAATESLPEPQADPLSPVLQQFASLGFELITIRRGTLHITALDGSVETLNDLQAEIKRTRKGQVTSIGSFTVRGQRLVFEATLTHTADKKLPDRWQLQVTFKSPLLQGSFDGYADLGEDLQLSGLTELSTASLRTVGRWFGLGLLSADSLGQTTVKGELTWARRSLAFDKARIEVDGNEGNGRLVLNLGGARPLLEATLDFAALNLTPYIEATRTQIFGFELPAMWGASFDISLPMIRHLDADLRISARRVTLKSYTLGQGAATISAQAGKLHADITELELASGGTLSAQVTAIMSEMVPSYAMRAKVEKLEIGAASAMPAGAPALSGRATLAVDLTGSGYSLADVAKRLSGKATLTMSEGGRMALDLKAVRAAAKSGARGWAELVTSPTNLDRLEARALIINGVAFAEEVQARAGDVALALTGRLGIVDGNMDARLLLKAGVPPDQALRLADPTNEALTLRGPWATPEVRGEDGEAPARDGGRAGPP